VLVGVAQAKVVEFEAKYPGAWMIHCHLPHHMMNSMMDLLRDRQIPTANTTDARAMQQMQALSQFIGVEHVHHSPIAENASSIPGFPQDAFMEMGMDEAVAKPETFGLPKNWSAGMMGMMTMVRVLPDKDYEEMAAAMDKKKLLTTEQEAELTQLWKKLVKLYHPDRFANDPDKLETYHKLTAAINQAKDNGDIETLREIAEDPHGFILRQGWAKLDFKDVEELAQLKRLHETLQKEIAMVTESLKQLRESPDYELCQLAEQKPGVLDELAAERSKQLEIENEELEVQAERLAKEIKKLSGQSSSRII
jgi:hypothetical protein